MIIKFKVFNQVLQKDYSNHIVSDSQKYLYVKFEFTSDWDNLTKYVQFTRGEQFYELMLDENNSKVVPWELLVGKGKIVMTVWGNTNGGALITTNSVTIDVEQTGMSEHEGSLVPTENAAAALLGQVTAKAQIATTKAAEASASATSASNSATSASASASNASTSATTATTQAGIATTKANAASTSATNAKTSEDNAKASETNALTYKNAASTSATNASTSEANALSYKNAASTSASNASTSESNALSYKNSASTSASNAATSEANALSYKNSASSSASSASASASTATTKAAEASTSATNAETSYQNAVSTLANKLDLSGGTMSGTIYTSNNSSFRRKGSSGLLQIGMENIANGGRLNLFGKDYSTSANAGTFALSAGDGTNVPALVGTPAGALTWNGRTVITTAGSTAFTGNIGSNKNSVLELVGRRSDITKGTAPSANAYTVQLVGRDSANANVANFSLLYRTDLESQGILQLNGATARGYAWLPAMAYPTTNNVSALGGSSYKWTTVYANTATINTSDERAKSNIRTYTDEELDAWGDVEWCNFQMNDSIEEKGVEKARIHNGLIAQRIRDVFAAHGLDISRYAFFCYDKWDAEAEQKDEEGNVVIPEKEAGDAYALRYSECIAIESAYQRRRADRLEERIARLESVLIKEL